MYYLYHFAWQESQAWKYEEDKLQRAKTHGFKSIIEAMVKLYWAVDVNRVAKLLDCTTTTITTAMRKRGFPVRMKGGYRGQSPDYSDLTGKRIGLLIIGNHFLRSKESVGVYYHCECECGNKTEVRRGNLIKKNPIQSCRSCRRKRGYGA